MSSLKRVVVIGTSCSGKTTFAADLAEKLRCGHIELDQLYWLPDWRGRPKEEFRSLVSEVTLQDRWVVDGNYSVVRDITWLRATAIIWLDYSFPVVFGRALWRSIRRLITREELFAGNRESFTKTFLSRDSILLWVLTTYHRRRRDYPVLFKAPKHAHLATYRLRTPVEGSRLLSRISTSGYPKNRNESDDG
jgi:adenylate kinase family enzyme